MSTGWLADANDIEPTYRCPYEPAAIEFAVSK